MNDAEMEIMNRLAIAGLVVSLAYGRCGESGVFWSVDVLNMKDASGFAKPYLASNCTEAVRIAEIESMNRGWL